MQVEISIAIPECLDGQVDISKPYRNYGVNGNLTSYGMDLELPALHLHKEVKSKDPHLIAGKVQATLAAWEKKYLRHEAQQHKKQQSSSAEELNQSTKQALEQLSGLLSHTLHVDDAVDWNSLKQADPFHVRSQDLVPTEQMRFCMRFDDRGLPTELQKKSLPLGPSEEEIRRGEPLWVRLFGKKKIAQKFAELERRWKEDVTAVEQQNEELARQFDEAVKRFRKRKAEFDRKQEEHNAAVNDMRARYERRDPGAIEEYCDLVLDSSEYPESFPKTWVLEYRESSSMLVVEYDLPSPSELPAVESYRYIASRDEIAEKPLSAAARKRLFNNVAYQICLRTIHELFEADAMGALDAVGFNGNVTHINPATGKFETKTILSVLAGKEAFLEFDLSQVQPKATFKHLKGVAASDLMDLSPIPPVIELDKTDKRFVEGRSVVDGLDDSVNLAAMDWEDFEHLVRELFEQEFGRDGGEVRVTQASADGGVDAIAFDPDPIRGGKIVIQAKRYTNTVGVAAVRDLYGTVMNEGATKGILVTTSDYGGDSYEFAKDKPLTLLNGNNLLSLLERHGHRARINVGEAKKQMGG